jgi:hypothetical protein
MNVSRLFLVAISAIMTFCFLTYRVGFGQDPASDADFQPRIEAEMPEGFPTFTQVGSVEVKEYPAYRKAVASTQTGSAFWTLFSHIKKNGIAMTTPVEMSYEDNGGALQVDSMAFLYGDKGMGQLGQQGNAEVVDIPRMLVVSTGVRGPRTDRAVDAAHARLKTWLGQNENSFSVAGPVRIMAYNSPFVPRDQNFFEVQIPVRRTDAS